MIPTTPEWVVDTQGAALVAPPKPLSLVGLKSPYSLSPGPEVIGQANGSTNKAWYAISTVGSDLQLMKWDTDTLTWVDNSHVLTITPTTSAPEQVTLAFDQNGGAVMFWIADGSVWGYLLNGQTGQREDREICPGTSVVAAMDYPHDTNNADSDITVCYVRDDFGYLRVQREDYLIEHEMGQEHPNLRFEEVGYSQENRYQIRATWKAYAFVPVLETSEDAASSSFASPIATVVTGSEVGYALSPLYAVDGFDSTSASFAAPIATILPPKEAIDEETLAFSGAGVRTIVIKDVLKGAGEDFVLPFSGASIRTIAIKDVLREAAEDLVLPFTGASVGAIAVEDIGVSVKEPNDEANCSFSAPIATLTY